MLVLNIRVPYKEAKPASCTPLAQIGIKVMDFCKQINAMDIEGVDIGEPIAARVVVLDKTNWSFSLKKPSVAYLIKKLNKKQLEYKDIKKIAEFKLSDMGTIDINKAINQVIGTVKSMKLIAIKE